MDQQNQTKLEEDRSKAAELSEKDLEQVPGGMIGTNYVQYQLASVVQSPRDSASGQVKEQIF